MFDVIVSELLEQLPECRHHGVCCSDISLLPDDDRLSAADVYFPDPSVVRNLRLCISGVGVMVELCTLLM